MCGSWASTPAIGRPGRLLEPRPGDFPNLPGRIVPSFRGDGTAGVMKQIIALRPKEPNGELNDGDIWLRWSTVSGKPWAATPPAVENKLNAMAIA